jgi:hypothetical protein
MNVIAATFPVQRALTAAEIEDAPSGYEEEALSARQRRPHASHLAAFLLGRAPELAPRRPIASIVAAVR